MEYCVSGQYHINIKKLNKMQIRHLPDNYTKQNTTKMMSSLENDLTLKRVTNKVKPTLWYANDTVHCKFGRDTSPCIKL